MPGGDRTGPMGMGPRTGRGAGYCAGAGAPGFMNRPFGGGFFGRGRGGGRGWRNMFYATGLPAWARSGMGAAGATTPASAPMPESAIGDISREEELEVLKRQAQQAADVLDSVRRRIGELEAGATE